MLQFKQLKKKKKNSQKNYLCFIIMKLCSHLSGFAQRVKVTIVNVTHSAQLISVKPETLIKISFIYYICGNVGGDVA